MWCPSVSLSVWANAWLAGRAAPDDVLDALSDWAPRHSVIAYDAVAAGRTGLPWPDINSAGAMSLLQTVRTASGRRDNGDWPSRPTIALVLPVPGDVRGLPPGTQFASDALAAEEALVVSGPDGHAVGLVPEFECPGSEETSDGEDVEISGLSWSVYSLPPGPGPDHPDIGEAEYALRSAVRSAADTLAGLRLTGTCDDPRDMVEQIVQAGRHHRIPDHAPERAVRALATAAHVDAIIAVSAGFSTLATHSASEARIADTALRPLASVVRTARSAAVSAILQSAWRP